MLPLDDATLAAIEASESIDPNKIDTAWTKQRWWQGQVDARIEAHFKLNAPKYEKNIFYSSQKPSLQELMP